MIPKAEHNLIWQLFSAQAEKVQEAARHYLSSGSEINTMINDLLAKYQAEGINMPYTLEDYRKDIVRSGLNLLTPQERLSGLAPSERLSGLAPSERLSGLAPEEVLTHYKPEEVFRHFRQEEIEAYLRSVKNKQ